MEQNQGNPDALKKRFGQIVPHMYGDNKICEGWCTFRTDPNKKYFQLPYKKALSDATLKEALAKIVKGYQDKAEKLAFLGSSQANEALNQTISSKAPKNR